MKKTGSIIQANKWFFVPYAVFLLLLGPVVFYYPKTSLHLALNQYHNTIFDLFFKNITHIGDGGAPFIIAAVFLLFSFRRAMQIAFTGAVAGISAQFLKRIVFSDILRPYALLKDNPDLHLVPGVEMHSSFSFPSGHTTTIFSLCLCLVLFSRTNYTKFALFILAIVVAYSRVYISQHFIIDIYFGSIVGVLLTIPLWQFVENAKPAYLNKSIMSILKQKSKNE